MAFTNLPSCDFVICNKTQRLQSEKGILCKVEIIGDIKTMDLNIEKRSKNPMMGKTNCEYHRQNPWYTNAFRVKLCKFNSLPLLGLRNAQISGGDNMNPLRNAQISGGCGMLRFRVWTV